MAADPFSQQRLERQLELLRLENRALRSRLAGRDAGERIAGPDDVLVPRAEYEELTRARTDLKWLVERIITSPVGRLARRRSGFRRIEQDWSE